MFKCKECKKKISRHSGKYGYGNCQSCANRKTSMGRKCSKATRTKLSNGQKGRPLTEFHRKQLSLYHADVSGERNAMFGKKGKLSPNWQGGKSFELYPLGWNKTFKEQIRYRDGYKCQICGCPEVECNRKLDVHHIDYDKKNIKPNNLITLCISCHMTTNFNRDYWYAYFTYIMEEK